MAFGTGTHETTQVVAQLLQNESQNSAHESVLDVGTGSGILAVLAHHLGFETVNGNDNDPECLRVAQENVIINKAESSVNILQDDISEISDSYDIVIANIIDGVLIQIQKDLVRCLKPGGRLIVSGILRERWPLFKEKFILNSRLHVKEVIEKGDWIGVTLHA
jgi:ribosomal protein L11 methyltransferase